MEEGCQGLWAVKGTGGQERTAGDPRGPAGCRGDLQPAPQLPAACRSPSLFCVRLCAVLLRCRFSSVVQSARMGFPGSSQMVKNLPAMQETWVRTLGQEDPLEKGMATHSSVLAWEIPWTEEPGGLQSMGL